MTPTLRHAGPYGADPHGPTRSGPCPCPCSTAGVGRGSSRRRGSCLSCQERARVHVPGRTMAPRHLWYWWACVLACGPQLHELCLPSCQSRRAGTVIRTRTATTQLSDWVGPRTLVAHQRPCSPAATSQLNGLPCCPGARWLPRGAPCPGWSIQPRNRSSAASWVSGVPRKEAMGAGSARGEGDSAREL